MPEPLLTRYFLLKSLDGGSSWSLEGTQDAHNGDAALKKFFGVPEDGVQVVAVTERSWQPRQKRTRIIETDILGAVEETPDLESEVEADDLDVPDETSFPGREELTIGRDGEPVLTQGPAAV